MNLWEVVKVAAVSYLKGPDSVTVAFFFLKRYRNELKTSQRRKIPNVQPPEAK